MRVVEAINNVFEALRQRTNHSIIMLGLQAEGFSPQKAETILRWAQGFHATHSQKRPARR